MFNALFAQKLKQIGGRREKRNQRRGISCANILSGPYPSADHGFSNYLYYRLTGVKVYSHTAVVRSPLLVVVHIPPQEIKQYALCLVHMPGAIASSLCKTYSMWYFAIIRFVYSGGWFLKLIIACVFFAGSAYKRLLFYQVSSLKSFMPV